MKKSKILITSGLILSTLFVSSCTPDTTKGEKKEYTFEVESIAGKKLQNVAVEIYDNNELVSSLMTDEDGCCSTDLENKDYKVEINNLPDGYYYTKNYSLKKDTFNYEFDILTRVADNPAPENTKYELKDVMHDFSVVDSDGNNFNLKTSLQTHSAVVINFWYTTCGYCIDEFPFMEEAYQIYKNEIEIIALSISDMNNAIADFKLDYELSFPMAYDSASLFNKFNFEGTPSTVIIDRFGIVSFIEVGAITATETFAKIFDQFIGDDYAPITNKGNEIDETIPNVSMPESSEIERIINQEGFNATYSPDTKEQNPAFAWPWLINEEEGAIYPANTGINNTAATIQTTITIPEGKAFAFDYLSSCENNYDVLYIIINGKIMQEISGVNQEYKTCYAFVSNQTKEYNISFCYFKDNESFEGKDLVYLKNLRLLDAKDIETPTYIYRNCATGNYNAIQSNYQYYSSTIYNENDGYYHIETKDGPLVFADLTYTAAWGQYSLMNYVDAGYAVVDNVDYGPLISKYALYANNGTNGYTPVTQELYEALNIVTPTLTKTPSEHEWLEICGYFEAYGTNGEEMGDPTIGLAPHNAFETSMNTPNSLTFTKPIVPRGYKFKFNVETAGVYKIKADSQYDTICWIYDENDEIIFESDNYARKYRLDEESARDFEIFFYFEANTDYYICPAFFDVGQLGSFSFSVSYESETYDLLTMCSPPFFTTELDKYGNMTDKVISGGIKIYFNEEDGLYHEYKEDGSIGSIIYADFGVKTLLFNYSLQEMIALNGFVFEWDDGTKEDYTMQARKILSSMINEGEEKGLVPVTEDVASFLQAVMDYYTFYGVENSWLKLCYYYQHFGAND